MGFVDKLEVTPLSDGARWRSDREFIFTFSAIDDRTSVIGNHVIKVPKGFVTDFASIPPLARIAGTVMLLAFLGQWLLPCAAFNAVIGLAWIVVMLADSLLHEGSYDRAAIVHDWLYYTRMYPRAECDRVLYLAMVCCGTREWKRLVIYWNVRLFGWVCWHDKRPKTIVVR